MKAKQKLMKTLVYGRINNNTFTCIDLFDVNTFLRNEIIDDSTDGKCAPRQLLCFKFYANHLI
jgi:hypothetical protein